MEAAFCLMLVLFSLTATVLTARLTHLAADLVDKLFKHAPAILKGMLSLALSMFKAFVRISMGLWRFYSTGVFRESRQDVGFSGVHVRVNPRQTRNILGASRAFRLVGESRQAPVTIEHELIR